MTMRPSFLLPVLISACLGCAAPGAALDAVAPGWTEALSHAPTVVAAHLRVAAAERAALAAGTLADPVVGVEAGQKKPANGERQPLYGARLEQEIPRWGERDAARSLAAAQTLRLRAEAIAVIGTEAAALAAAGAEADAARQQLALIQEAQGRIMAMHTVLVARSAAGKGGLTDLLAHETWGQQLTLMAAETQRRLADAEDEMRSSLGLPAGAPVPVPQYPDPGAIDLERAPGVLQARADQVEALATLQESESRSHSATSLGLAWERESAGYDEQSDKVTLGLTFSLPIHRSAYDDPAAAARLRARASDHAGTGARRQAETAIRRARRAMATAAQAKSTAAELAARTQTDYEAILGQVGQGTTSLTTLLDLLDRLTQARQQAVDAELTSRLALAELWKLAPPALTPATEATP